MPRSLGRLRVAGFVRDLAMTGGTQIAQAGCAMIAGVLVSRTIGPAGNGTLSVLMAIGTTAVLLASLGVHYSGVYFLGRFSSQKSAVIANTILFAAAGGLVAAGGVAIAALIFRRQLLGSVPLGLFVLFLAFVPCNYFNQFTRRLALGDGRIGIYNLPDLIGGAGLVVGTAVLLLLFGHQLVPLVLLRVVLEAAAAVVLLTYARRLTIEGFVPSRKLLGKQVRYGIRNYAGSLLWLLLLQSDLLLCNYFLGRTQAGVYSVAVSLGLPLTLLASVIGTLVFQRVSRDRDRQSRVANTNRVLRVLAPASVIAGPLLAIACHWAIPFVYGARFAGAGDALAILVPGLVFLNLETVLMSFMAAEGSPPIVYIAPLCGLLLNFTANLWVIPRFGIDGASATSSVGYALVLVLVATYYIRSTGVRLRELVVLRKSDLAAVHYQDRHDAPSTEPGLITLSPNPEKR